MAKKTGSLDWLTIGQAAKYLGVSKDTLRRWEKRGKMKSYRTPGGRRRYTMYDLELAMKPQKTVPLITHRPPKQKPPPKPSSEPILEQRVQTRTFAEGESKEQSDATPETAPKAVQPSSRLSTPIILLLTIVLILLTLFAFSGVGKLLLLRLKSSPEMLNPTPQTHLHSRFGSSLLIFNYQEE